MDWEDALQETLRVWTRIRGTLAQTDSLDLLIDINAVCALCEKSKEDAAATGELDKCRYCLFYEQFGGCREVSARMSEAVAAKDWDTLRVLVDTFLTQLQAVKVPLPTDAT